MTKEQLEIAIFGTDEEVEMTDERARVVLKAHGIDENELVNKFIGRLLKEVSKLTQENNRLMRDNGRLQNRIENADDAIKNLVEKIEQLENLQVYEGLDAEILETSE